MSPPTPHTVLIGEGMEGAEAMVAAEAANPSNVDIDALPYVDQQMEQIDQMKWVAATATHASCALLLARCSLPLAPCPLPLALPSCLLCLRSAAPCRLPLATRPLLCPAACCQPSTNQPLGMLSQNSPNSCSRFRGLRACPAQARDPCSVSATRAVVLGRDGGGDGVGNSFPSVCGGSGSCRR